MTVITRPGPVEVKRTATCNRCGGAVGVIELPGGQRRWVDLEPVPDGDFAIFDDGVTGKKLADWRDYAEACGYDAIDNIQSVLFGRCFRHHFRQCPGRDGTRLVAATLDGALGAPHDSASGRLQRDSVTAIKKQWRAIVGDDLARHCEPIAFSNGVLRIRSTMPSTVALDRRRDDIIRGVNELLTSGFVAKIEIRGVIRSR